MSYTSTNDERTSALPTSDSVSPDNFAQAHCQSESAQASLEVGHKEYNGNRSGESRVDLNHFDSAGVDELKRTLSKPWQDERPTSLAKSTERGTSEDEFDFEKVLRKILKRCARPFSYCNSSSYLERIRNSGKKTRSISPASLVWSSRICESSASARRPPMRLPSALSSIRSIWSLRSRR